MEGQGRDIPIQHNQTLSCITALSELPSSYRAEIKRGVSTGWKCIDRFLQGLRPGEMTVVTADTGVGKTTFCIQLVINCALQGVAVWINSWEMKPEATMRKIASVVLRKPMKLQNFSEHENEQFDEWARRHKVFVNVNTSHTDIYSLEIEMRKAKEYGVEVVLLDHLDYLVSSKKEKLHEAIDDAVKKLHELAFNLSVHILLICHPRQSATQAEEIGIHSLKGSSSIKQYADNVVILHRCARTDSQSHPGKIKVRIAKNRMFGTEGTTYLFFQELWDGYAELELPKLT